MNAVLKKFIHAGCSIETTENSITLKSPQKLLPTDVTAKPYPAFPTDMQAQWIALMTQADGMSRIHEVLFEGRLNWLVELEKMR